MGQSLSLFLYFRSIFCRKTLGFSGMQTGIVRVEGKHADPLSATPALSNIWFHLHCCDEVKHISQIIYFFQCSQFILERAKPKQCRNFVIPLTSLAASKKEKYSLRIKKLILASGQNIIYNLSIML